MVETTIASGVTTSSTLLSPDGWLIIKPASGATATVEQTTATPADIAAGSATWTTIHTTTVNSALRNDEEMCDVYIRITASGGSVNYYITGELSRDERYFVRNYSKTSINSFTPSWSLDTSGNPTGLVGPDGGTHATLGSNTVTVGAGGNYSTLFDAIQAVCPSEYSNFTQVTTVSGTASSFSSVLLIADETLRTKNIRTGWYIRKQGDTRRHKIKAVSSETALVLCESWDGSAISGVTTFVIERLDWKYFALLPGEHTFPCRSTSLGNLPHGVALYGFGRDVTRLSEDISAGSALRIFNAVGACQFHNMSIAPTLEFGAMDGIANFQYADSPAGSDILFSNCYISSSNPAGVHSGNGMWLPLVAQSRTVIRSCDVESESYFSLSDVNGATDSVSTSILDVIGSRFTVASGYDTGADNRAVIVTALHVGRAITANIVGSSFDFEGLAINPLTNDVTGIKISAAATVNMTGSRVKVENTDSTSTAKSIGIDITDGATVNVHASDVDASGTAAIGIRSNHASATLNVRAGSRVKGTAANSGIVNTAGTVSVSPNADVIGGTTGTIGATAT